MLKLLALAMFTTGVVALALGTGILLAFGIMILFGLVAPSVLIFLPALVGVLFIVGGTIWHGYLER